MKKILFFFVAMCGLLYACSSADEPLVQPEQRPNLTVLEMYDIDEAVDIANEIAASLDISSSRVSTRKATLRGVHEYKTSKSRTEESPFYVVNYDDNQGYAIIAKKRIAQPVMAVINDGSYEEGDIIDNPGFLMFMDVASSFVEIDSTKKPIDWEWKPGDGPIPATQYKTERDTLEQLFVNPKTQNFRWGQHNPEGLLCPNGVSGCANTALFISMAYFKTPTYFVYTYSGATLNHETLIWSSINRHIYAGDNCGTGVHNTIARVCRELGQRTKSKYNPATNLKPASTSTSRKEMWKVAKSTLFPNKTVTDLTAYKEFDDFYDVLDFVDSGLVLMCGELYNQESDKTTDTKSGHAWIVDGCRYAYVQVKTYKKAYNDPSWVLASTRYESTDYLSVNWGWNGAQNGYFFWKNFNPTHQDYANPIYMDIEYVGIK